MKIVAIHNSASSRYYRLVPMLKHMQDKGHKAILEGYNAKTIQQRIDWADVIVFQMVFAPMWAEYARKKGKTVIFECDDMMHIVPKTHYAYQDTKGIKNRITWYRKIWEMFKYCDGFISTNEELDRKYGWLFKESLVFPNYCSLEHWLKPYKRNNTDRVRLLWAGSTSHTGDLQMMKPVLKKLLEKYPQLQFIYMGMGGAKTTDLTAQFTYGRDFFKELGDNRESLLPVPGNVYPYLLAGLQADIAIAPLVKNHFNKYKSQCKFMEYSINKIPGVYSGWFYKDVINKQTGLLAQTPDDWVTAISYLIENPHERDRMGNNAYETVKDLHNINNYLTNWQEFVEGLYEFTKNKSKSQEVRR